MRCHALSCSVMGDKEPSSSPPEATSTRTTPRYYLCLSAANLSRPSTCSPLAERSTSLGRPDHRLDRMQTSKMAAQVRPCAGEVHSRLRQLSNPLLQELIKHWRQDCLPCRYCIVMKPCVWAFRGFINPALLGLRRGNTMASCRKLLTIQFCLICSAAAHTTAQMRTGAHSLQ